MALRGLFFGCSYAIGHALLSNACIDAWRRSTRDNEGMSRTDRRLPPPRSAEEDHAPGLLLDTDTSVGATGDLDLDKPRVRRAVRRCARPLTEAKDLGICACDDLARQFVSDVPDVMTSDNGI